MAEIAWQKCRDFLQGELPSQQFNTWIRPLEATVDGSRLRLIAPNRFIKDWVSDRFLNRIQELMAEIAAQPLDVVVDIRGRMAPPAPPDAALRISA